MSKKKKKSTHRPHAASRPVHLPTQQDQHAARQHAEQARLDALEALKDVNLGAPELDEEGYEVIPESVGKTAAGAYRFKVDGKKYELPNLQYIDIDLALGLQHMDEMAAFRAIFNRYTPKLMSKIDGTQLQHIGKRWMEHSELAGEKISVGES